METKDDVCPKCFSVLLSSGACSNPRCGPGIKSGFVTSTPAKRSYHELLAETGGDVKTAYKSLEDRIPKAPIPKECLADDDLDRPTPVEIPIAQDGRKRPQSGIQLLPGHPAKDKTATDEH